MGISTSFFQQRPADIKISFQTDIGNDPDDTLGLLLLIQAMQKDELPKKCIKEIVTTLYKPHEKAEITAKVCKYMDSCDIPIYPGFGSTPKTPDDFMTTYPFWPVIWGIPGFTNAVSLGQAKGFQKLPFNPDQIIPNKDVSLAMQETAALYGESEVVVGMAPHSDLANVIHKCRKIERIVLMGGYFGKEVEGAIELSRPGYNTAIDPDASEKILTQSKVPVLIFNSQHITTWDFSWMQEDILAIICSTEKNPLGEAIAEDLAQYWTMKKPKPYGSMVMADVLTVYAGVLHPELIKSTMPVEFHFNNKYYHNPDTKLDEPIHMMHPQAKTLFTVRKKDGSNVHIVTELTVDIQTLRKKIAGEIAALLFFKDRESFYKAVEEQKQKPLGNDQIKSLVGEIYPKLK